MGLKFNREDVTLGAIPVGQYPTDTSTTPPPTGLPHRAVDWGVLQSGPPGDVLTVNADGSIGWTAPGNPLTVGNPVAGGSPYRFLYEDPNQNLAASTLLFQEYGSLYMDVNAGFNISMVGTTTIYGNYNAVGNSVLTLDLSTDHSGPLGNALTIRAPLNQTSPLVILGKLSSASTNRACGIIDAGFNSSTDASWTGNLFLYAGDYTSSNAGMRLGVQIQSNGSAALVGLFGATPVVQPTQPGTHNTTAGYTPGSSTAVTVDGTFQGGTGSSAYTIGDIVTALKALGVLTP